MIKLILLLIVQMYSLTQGYPYDMYPVYTDNQIREALSTCVVPRGDYRQTCSECNANCQMKTLTCMCNTKIYGLNGYIKKRTSIRLSEACYYRNFNGELKCGKEECPLSYVEI